MKISKSIYDFLGIDVVLTADESQTDRFSNWVRKHWTPTEQVLVATQLLKEGDLFLDLGSNIGTFSIPVAKKTGARCIAFEALKKNIQIFLRGVDANELNGSVQWVLGAITGASSEVRIAGESAYGVVSEKGDRVLSYSLNDCINEFDLKCLKLIKMDIEGCELDAIKNADVFFNTFQDAVWVFEANAAHCHRMGHKPQDLLRVFEKHGYIIYLSKDGRLDRRTSAEVQEAGLSDYIATKTSLENELHGFRFEPFSEEERKNDLIKTLSTMKRGYVASTLEQIQIFQPDLLLQSEISQIINKPR